MARSKTMGAIVLVLIFAFAGWTYAATPASQARTFMNGDVVCSTVNTRYQTGVACVLKGGGGYAVGITDHAVIVTNARGRTVFQRVQP